MSKNGMPTFRGNSDYVNLTRLPTPKTEYVVNFERLTGGLNLYAPDYRLKVNESPDMENMLWKNGTLCSRYGQSYVTEQTGLGTGISCTQELYWDNAFFHIGNKIYYGEPGSDMELTELCDLSDYWHGRSGETYSPQRGTFLRYGDDLFYKAPGLFVRIHYNGSGFEASDVADTAFVPTVFLNADWRTGSGDSYQPVNRLTSERTLSFNAGTDEKIQTFTGDGTHTTFEITLTDFVYVTDVAINGASYGNWAVTWSGSTAILNLYMAPPNNAPIMVRCQCAVHDYQLPDKGSNVHVTKVVVDGAELSSGWSFTDSTGVVNFTNAPPVTQPLSDNTVQITYTVSDTNATDFFNSVMDCPYAAVYGGAQNLCMVMGGCRAQPNAFFWNGNNIAMDVSYWPAEQYNLGGDTEDTITGFGKQQGMLIVFKNRSVGKVSMQFTTTDMSSSDRVKRTMIEMDYTNINSLIGCDLPWSIQLIENNLVFCNTQQGVHFIRDSSAAYENNIICVSVKVNGGNGRVGLLDHVRGADIVCSFDDNHRYWLIADGKVFCWDYELSKQDDPSWFYLSGVNAVAMFLDVDTIYHLNAAGRVTVFDRSFADYGAGFERRYAFATQYFRSYERLKTVTHAIFTLRTDTDCDARITYHTDYEKRDDLTNISYRVWRLAPRDLSRRDLYVMPFAYVARRRPGCKHIRHFSMTLTCDTAGYDMPLLSAQVMYKYEGRDR